jgi:hypothetical protein
VRLIGAAKQKGVRCGGIDTAQARKPTAGSGRPGRYKSRLWIVGCIDEIRHLVDVSRHRVADTSRIAASAIEIVGPETDQDNAKQINDLDDGADRGAAQS